MTKKISQYFNSYCNEGNAEKLITRNQIYTLAKKWTLIFYKVNENNPDFQDLVRNYKTYIFEVCYPVLETKPKKRYDFENPHKACLKNWEFQKLYNTSTIPAPFKIKAVKKTAKKKASKKAVKSALK